jgi:hypothetical protein
MWNKKAPYLFWRFGLLKQAQPGGGIGWVHVRGGSMLRVGDGRGKRRHSRLDLVAVAVDDESELEELLWALRLPAGRVQDYGGVVDCRFAAWATDVLAISATPSHPTSEKRKLKGSQVRWGHSSG